jgi:hypothetical protein
MGINWLQIALISQERTLFVEFQAIKSYEELYLLGYSAVQPAESQ